MVEIFNKQQMIRSTKQFTISSDRVNRYGFRVITEGIDLGQFMRNPIMLWMHNRPDRGSSNDILPLGYWEDVHVSGKELIGTPVFDDKDAFAARIYQKVESGVIRMASAGLMPVSWSDASENEDGVPWLVKSVLDEVSICDIGANNDAMAAVALYEGKDRRRLNLSEGALANMLGRESMGRYLTDALNAHRIDMDEYRFMREMGADSYGAVRGFVEKRPEGYQLLRATEGKTWQELFRSAGLATVKRYDNQRYRELFKGEFGHYPNN